MAVSREDMYRISARTAAKVMAQIRVPGRLKDLETAIADEEEASLTYLRLSKDLDQIGLHDAAFTVSKIAIDESRHKRELEEIVRQVTKKT